MTIWRLAFVLYALALLTATHWPKMVINPASGLRVDIAAHFGAYGLLMLLMTRAGFFARPWHGARNIWLSALGAAAVAGGDEITQSIPGVGRVSDWQDYAANMVGILMATGGLFAIARIFFKHSATETNRAEA